jgi:hypothetical protein
VVHTCNPRTGEAEARGLRVQGQPGIHRNPILKNKYMQGDTKVKVGLLGIWKRREKGRRDKKG